MSEPMAASECLLPCSRSRLLTQNFLRLRSSLYASPYQRQLTVLRHHFWLTNIIRLIVYSHFGKGSIPKSGFLNKTNLISSTGVGFSVPVNAGWRF